MCNKCKKSVVEIGLLPETSAMRGCAKLWQTWCRQNKEIVEKDVISWLYENSQCLRIMGLQALVPDVPVLEHKPGYLRMKVMEDLSRPYRRKKKAHGGSRSV